MGIAQFVYGVCPECGLRFPSEVELKKHLIDKHGYKKCPKDNEMFSDKNKLAKHIAENHPEMIKTGNKEFWTQVVQQGGGIVNSVLAYLLNKRNITTNPIVQADIDRQIALLREQQAKAQSTNTIIIVGVGAVGVITLLKVLDII